MNCAHSRFYEELNEFLPQHKRKSEFAYEFMGAPSLKDAILFFKKSRSKRSSTVCRQTPAGTSRNSQDVPAVTGYAGRDLIMTI